MRNYGTVKANYKIVITPSGHYIETGHADYNAYGEVTLVNTSTGEEWTLQNGTNPWHWIEYNNGSFRFHYLWNEVYKSGNNVLNLHLQGFITVDKDGIVTKTGFYFFRIQAGSYIETKKMVLMKSSIEE
jgi:hypothetical protein